MKQRRRIYYSEAQKAEMWDRWQNGEPLRDIAASFDRHHSSVREVVTRDGGIRPKPRTRAQVSLTPLEREVISRGIAAQQSIRAIAYALGRSPSTISREINRNGGSKAYRASEADAAAWDRPRRPKLCKLSNRPELCRIIAGKLKRQWSPEQIAGWLKREYPDEECYHVSHETIYKSLFVQARGVLKRELLGYLSTQRVSRRPKKVTLKGKRLGNVPNAIPISERPASVEDRAIPGHWEGDLIEGSNNSYIVTLVERHSRYVLLAKVPDKKSATVVKALVKQANQLPTELYKSLTWDRGGEMKSHAQFTTETNISVYFCDPRSPWQRGTNENTNRLLRDYLPKGTNLSVHSQAKLNSIARQLNERPRKTLDYETPAARFDACVAATL
jgi:IS30 family transposase